MYKELPNAFVHVIVIRVNVRIGHGTRRSPLS